MRWAPQTTIMNSKIQSFLPYVSYNKPTLKHGTTISKCHYKYPRRNKEKLSVVTKQLMNKRRSMRESPEIRKLNKTILRAARKDLRGCNTETIQETIEKN